MARDTLLWRGLVKKYGAPRDDSDGFVAAFTGHVAMGTLQGKRRLRFMVERRWFPFRVVMTGGALCDADLGELRRMRIQVARFAPWRFRFEICDAKASSRI